jgi:hypothetical protein
MVDRPICLGVTKSSARCKRKAISDKQFCHQHAQNGRSTTDQSLPNMDAQDSSQVPQADATTPSQSSDTTIQDAIIETPPDFFARDIGNAEQETRVEKIIGPAKSSKRKHQPDKLEKFHRECARVQTLKALKTSRAAALTCPTTGKIFVLRRPDAIRKSPSLSDKEITLRENLWTRSKMNSG